jgi:hypothetical protein
MSHIVRIEPLALDQIELAFPLARIMAAELTLERWRGFARALADSQAPNRHGIMAAWSSAGYLQGMFGYRVTPDLWLGRVLQIDNIIALGVAGGGRTATALVEAARALAASEGCRAVRARVPANLAPLFDRHDLVPLPQPPGDTRMPWRSWLVAQESGCPG